MKDIKSYVIGFLTCACMFLIMGQTEGNDQMEHVMKMVNKWSLLLSTFLNHELSNFISMSRQANKTIVEEWEKVK